MTRASSPSAATHSGAPVSGVGAWPDATSPEPDVPRPESRGASVVAVVPVPPAAAAVLEVVGSAVVGAVEVEPNVDPVVDEPPNALDDVVVVSTAVSSPSSPSTVSAPMTPPTSSSRINSNSPMRVRSLRVVPPFVQRRLDAPIRPAVDGRVWSG